MKQLAARMHSFCTRIRKQLRKCGYGPDLRATEGEAGKAGPGIPDRTRARPTAREPDFPPPPDARSARTRLSLLGRRRAFRRRVSRPVQLPAETRNVEAANAVRQQVPQQADGHEPAPVGSLHAGRRRWNRRHTEGQFRTDPQGASRRRRRSDGDAVLRRISDLDEDGTPASVGPPGAGAAPGPARCSPRIDQQHALSDSSLDTLARGVACAGVVPQAQRRRRR